jgi:hypothetical protein
VLADQVQIFLVQVLILTFPFFSPTFPPLSSAASALLDLFILVDNEAFPNLDGSSSARWTCGITSQKPYRTGGFLIILILLLVTGVIIVAVCARTLFDLFVEGLFVLFLVQQGFSFDEVVCTHGN